MPRHLIKRLERLEHQTPSNAFEHLTVEQIERIGECYAMSQQLASSFQALSTAECLAAACEALPDIPHRLTLSTGFPSIPLSLRFSHILRGDTHGRPH